MHRPLPTRLWASTPRRVSGDLGASIARTSAVRAVLVVLVAIVIAGLAPVAMGQAQDAATFPNLKAGTRVYDETGSSLTAEQVAEVEQRLRDLEAIDADVVVMVRALDATPEETLNQVEALQQAWVAETGANQDNAIAILINRNPNDPRDARAGIYVGSTFDDGNVPRGEQEAIVTDALIPPLRDGDVFGSLTATIDRLETSIVEGPPRSVFEDWASGAASSWVPWVGLAAALAGIGASLSIFRTRRRITAPDQRPTLTRPGTLPPALAGALATGGPQASAVPAIILDLATRHALAIEPESEGRFFSKPKIQVRCATISKRRSGINWNSAPRMAWSPARTWRKWPRTASPYARRSAHGCRKRAGSIRKQRACGCACWRSPSSRVSLRWVA